MRASAVWPARSRRSAGELGAGGGAPRCQRRAGLLVDARVLDLRREAGDPLLQPCDALAERVDRLLQVVDLHLLRDDRAERREPRDGVLHSRRGHAHRQRRGAVGAGGVRHADHVAAERPRGLQRLLRRLGQGVGVGHLDRQARDDALRTTGRRPGRGRRASRALIEPFRRRRLHSAPTFGCGLRAASGAVAVCGRRASGRRRRGVRRRRSRRPTRPPAPPPTGTATRRARRRGSSRPASEGRGAGGVEAAIASHPRAQDVRCGGPCGPKLADDLSRGHALSPFPRVV